MNAPHVPRAVQGVVEHRLLDALPAVYAETDRGAGRGELRRLLAAFEAVLLGTPGAASPRGYEECIDALPSLLALDAQPGGFDAAMRDAFAPWLASQWVAFTPFAQVDPARLRRIVAGIVPMYGRRGTAAYLVQLLRLCFDELADVRLREHLSGGFVVGTTALGDGTPLGAARAFAFAVEVRLHPRAHGWGEAALARLRASLNAVIDFAKPAHTACELSVVLPHDAHASGS
jgi:phage tail-like protein